MQKKNAGNGKSWLKFFILRTKMTKVASKVFVAPKTRSKYIIHARTIQESKNRDCT